MNWLPNKATSTTLQRMKRPKIETAYGLLLHLPEVRHIGHLCRIVKGKLKKVKPVYLEEELGVYDQYTAGS